jgi:hypothetical protein
MTARAAGRRRTAGIKSSLALSLILLALLAACDIRPGNAIMFRIAGKRTFNTATLTQLDTGASPKPIKLRFTDTNVFQYNKPLAPGRYKLVLRGDRSFTAVREIDVTADKWLYDLPAIEDRAGPEAVGRGRVTGRVETEKPPVPSDVYLVFVGEQFVVRNASTQNGAFSVDAPPPGSYRVELHAPGKPPRSWAATTVDVTVSDTDLGLIRLP